MDILVVGGAGYIGSVMARRLTDSGYRAVILDDFSTGNRKAIPEGITLYEGDLGDRTLLAEIFKKESISLVMHFAAKIQVGESVERPDLYYGNNLAKVTALLDAMNENECRMLVFSSTAAVYGNPENFPVDEDTPTNPINPYGASKLFMEQIIRDYGKAFGMRSVILRYFNAAGASLDGETGESQKVKQNLIPIVLQNTELGKTSIIFGDDWDTPDGTCIRDYIHIEDIVEAHIKGIEYLENGGTTDVFNLGSENGASVKEVIEMVRECHNGEVKATVGPRRAGDPAQLIAHSSKANNILGWSPKHSDLETIIKSAYQWHFNRRY
jgi:UDP-glucose 4-epimerase